MCADHDTRSNEGYAPEGEVLPGERSVAGQAAAVAADTGRSHNLGVSDGFGGGAAGQRGSATGARHRRGKPTRRRFPPAAVPFT